MPYHNRKDQYLCGSITCRKSWDVKSHKAWRDANPEASRAITKRHKKLKPEAASRRNRRYSAKRHRRIVALFGGACVSCGTTDWRVLQVNHINGNGRLEAKGTGANFHLRILRGERATDDLDLRCANCNILYEYELGRRGETFEVHA